MGKTKEIGSRALIDGLNDFLTEPTANQKCIVDIIKEYIDKREKSISLCFRGDYATLYYRCKQLLRIEYRSRKKQVKGFFNFKYARFNAEAETYRIELGKLGVKFGKDESNIWIVLDGEDKVKSDDLRKILEKYIELIDSWIECKRTKTISESDRQQQLFAINFANVENTYFDIEYREPRDSLINAGYYDYVEGGIEAKKAEFIKNCGGRFDLLGLRKTAGGYILQFVEVKTKEKACDGNAGISKHVNDYTKYCRYSKLVNKRKSDAVYTVNLLSEILNTDNRIKVEDIIDHEIVFIFTDCSVNKVEQYRQTLEEKNIKIECYDKNLNRAE